MSYRHVLVLSLALSGAACFAQDAGNAPPSDRGGHRGPPPEAIAACQGKTEGTSVSITMRDGRTMTGTCKTGPDGTLAARPDHMPPGPPPAQ
ncbi:hypothetical protein AAFF27_22170 [Xylophilus sp. GW821-FHT01B05]